MSAVCRIILVIAIAFVCPSVYDCTAQSVNLISISPADASMVRAANGSTFKTPQGETVFRFRNIFPLGGDIRIFELDAEPLKGRKVSVKTSIRADAVSEKPNAWNGVKVMLKIETPAGILWPQVPLGTGTFDWQTAEGRLYVPAEAVKVSLVLGLESVTGELWMRAVTLEPQPIPEPVPPAPRDQPVFTGHGPEGLRGAMVSPQTLGREDFDVLTLEWRANLVRWQLIRSRNAPEDFESYDIWLEERLVELDRALGWARSNGTRIVVDLHSPPGGGDSIGGYQDASGDLFRVPAAQDHFVLVWEKIAARYRGDDTVWGFDLANEPIEEGTSEGCLDWNGLALRAATAIRVIDPGRTLIVEPAEVGSARGFYLLRPLPLPGIVYSFHMYLPGKFTHQGVFSLGPQVRYPGKIDGTYWDKTTLLNALEPAIRFAETYRVQMYVGEFGVIRWAPGAERYLSDLISIFEEHGWDWSFHAFREWHGWSPEYGPDKNDKAPSKVETERLKILKSAFGKNRR